MKLIFALLVLPLICLSQKNQKELLYSYECETGRKTAEKSIQKDSIITYYSFGLLILTQESEGINAIQDSILMEDFEVANYYLGCVVMENYLCHNEVVLQHLEKKYGYDIFDSTYSLAKQIYCNKITKEGYEEVVNLPVVSAEFPGGMDSLFSYLSRSIDIDTSLNFLPGKRYVRFQIGKDGRVSDCKMLNSPDDILDDYLFKILEDMPAWTPAEMPNQVKVKCYFTLPFNVSE